MDINSLVMAYFSPTKTTKRVIEAICEGIDVSKTYNLDLTKPKDADSNTSNNEIGQLVIWCPCLQRKVATGGGR